VERLLLGWKVLLTFVAAVDEGLAAAFTASIELRGRRWLQDFFI
jgi:hypothetical protein